MNYCATWTISNGCGCWAVSGAPGQRRTLQASTSWSAGIEQLPNHLQSRLARAGEFGVPLVARDRDSIDDDDEVAGIERAARRSPCACREAAERSWLARSRRSRSWGCTCARICSVSRNTVCTSLVPLGSIPERVARCGEVADAAPSQPESPRCPIIQRAGPDNDPGRHPKVNLREERRARSCFRTGTSGTPSIDAARMWSKYGLPTRPPSSRRAAFRS